MILGSGSPWKSRKGAVVRVMLMREQDRLYTLQERSCCCSRINAYKEVHEILPNYIMFTRRRESPISQHALENVEKMRDILQSRLARRLSYQYRQKEYLRHALRC